MLDAPSPTLPRHDLHNHTVHCGHASEQATVANIVARGAELGLEYLGFSEHVIFAEHAPRIQAVRDDLERLGPLLPSPTVLVGVEIDADPNRFDGSWIADPGPVDYVILSPHLIPELGIGHWEFRTRGIPEREARRLGQVWLDWYQACVERGGMHILGHPLREPISLGMLTLNDDRTFGRTLTILNKAAQRGVAFELNNGWAIGVRRAGQFRRYAALIRELKSAGMRFSCGSDSHAVSEVGSSDGITELAQAADLQPGDWLDPGTLRQPRG